mgnify:CR=1 FL=1
MRYPAYPEYQESGVQWLGRVPGHWNVKRGRFAMRVNPPAPLLRKLEEDQEVSFVPMDAVNEYGGIRLDQTRVKGEVGGGYTEFQDGDVVIAKITPCFENGKGSLATGLINSAAYGTTELHVLRIAQALDNRFLFYLTVTDGYRKLGESEMYGAGGQKRVPPEFCKDFLTPLPPLPEQTAISDFLDRETGRVDTLVAKKRRLIALLREKRSALISRTVTRGLPDDAAREFGLEPHSRFKDSGIEWLGEVPEGWEATHLKYATRMIVDCPHETPEYDGDGGYHVVRTADLSSGLLDLSNTYRVAKDEYLRRIRRSAVEPGDILYSREGERWGFAATAPESPKVCLGQRMMQFRVASSFDPRYLMWHLNASCVYEQGILDTAGSTAPHVNVSTIRNYWLVSPPLPEQTTIATYLDRETTKIDRLVEKVEAAIDRLQEYRTALITAAVTGKIDVREIAA